MRVACTKFVTTWTPLKNYSSLYDSYLIYFNLNAQNFKVKIITERPHGSFLYFFKSAETPYSSRLS